MSGSLFPTNIGGCLGYAQFSGTQLAADGGVVLGTTVPNEGLATAAIPAGATYMLVQAEGGNIRWRNDGTAPTTAIGMFVAESDDPVGFAGNLRNFIFVAADTATLNVAYF